MKWHCGDGPCHNRGRFFKRVRSELSGWNPVAEQGVKKALYPFQWPGGSSCPIHFQGYALGQLGRHRTVEKYSKTPFNSFTTLTFLNKKSFIAINYLSSLIQWNFQSERNSLSGLPVSCIDTVFTRLYILLYEKILCCSGDAV